LEDLVLGRKCRGGIICETVKVGKQQPASIQILGSRPELPTIYRKRMLTGSDHFPKLWPKRTRVLK